MKIVEVYTDGSYSAKFPGIVGYGIVIIQPDENIEMSGFSKDELFLSSKHISAETLATMLAVKRIVESGFRDGIIKIYHDNEGVKGWVTGWKTNKPSTKMYKDFMLDLAKKYNLQYEFQWVKAHNKNKLNERADELAKAGIRSGVVSA